MEQKNGGSVSSPKTSWVEWKAHYLEAHKGRKLHIWACGGKKPFNSVNVATKVPANSNLNTTPYITNIDHLDDYLDNIANTATNEKTVIEQLVATNSKQEATINTQASTIKILTVQVKTLNKQVLSLGSKVVGSSTNSGSWVKNAYSWLHSYGVRKDHTSLSCFKHLNDHKEKASSRNIMGGKEFNKGWDD